MIDTGKEFTNRVNQIVSQIPTGRVMTYGQIAAICGSARASRVVGGIAHYGDPSLPWHRVVNKAGGLATGYPGGRLAHRKHLESEGIVVAEDFHVNVQKLLWYP